MADEPSFPAAADDDSEDVRWALETANTMWSRGEARDALRWLRRAAETASDEDDDLRSVVLAAAAADLRNHLESQGIPHTEFPPAVSDDDDEEIQVDDEEIQVDESIPETSPSSPPDLEVVEEDEDEEAAPTQRTVPPQASSSGPPAKAPPAPAASSAIPKVPRPPKAPAEAQSGERRPRGSSRRTSSRSTERGGPPPIHGAVRVAVTTGSSPGAYRVTVLGPDEHAMKGATEALLVPLDPDTHYTP